MLKGERADVVEAGVVFSPAGVAVVQVNNFDGVSPDIFILWRPFIQRFKPKRCPVRTGCRIVNTP
ncbi:hypothetical protein [Sodalis sp. dw_96]|uniref:hypothetical protein n=1 Tax=Sodalis sp. dw_96 TaxID=2719794 RepID=UPI001BD1CEDC|nr:hypothetical protein [Sodalis sp. dw_96]